MNRTFLFVGTSLAFVLVFVSIYLISSYAPIAGDDFGYMRSLPVDFWDWSRHDWSISDVIVRLLGQGVWHYRFENGRFLTGILLRLILTLPRIVYVSCNALVWILLSNMIWQESGYDSKWRGSIFAVVMIVLLIPDAAIWSAGSINYLWGFTFTLFVVRKVLNSNKMEFNSSSAFRFIIWLAMFVFGFIVAGFHELVSIVTCFGLLAYWMPVVIKKRFAINGKILFSMGYVIGSFAVVFAPSTINRANGTSYLMPDAQFLYTVARKLMALVRICMNNPLTIVVLIAFVLVCFQKELRKKLSSRDWIWLFLSFISLCITLTLTDGGHRHGWVCCAIVLISALRLLPMVFRFFVDKEWLKRGLSFVLVFVALVIVAVTIVCSSRNNNALNQMINDWHHNKHNVAIAFPQCFERRFEFFDRSNIDVIGWGVFPLYRNSAMAKFYGKSCLIVLDRWLYENLYFDDKITSNKNFKLRNVDWFADPGHDVIVKKCTSCNKVAGDVVEFKPRYDKCGIRELSAIMRIIKRAKRDGYAKWSTMSSDKEILSENAIKGFVVDTPHGRYIVLRHNPNIARDRILNLTECYTNKE